MVVLTSLHFTFQQYKTHPPEAPLSVGTKKVPCDRQQQRRHKKLENCKLYFWNKQKTILGRLTPEHKAFL
jgi:hypothetical protein